jgi:hypothetical protein
MLTLADDQKTKGLLSSLLSQARRLGIAEDKAASLADNGRRATV